MTILLLLITWAGGIHEPKRIILRMAPAKSAYLRFLLLWAAVVPLVTINVSYLTGVSFEHLPACIPYLSGCTSVSATGRVAPESLIFKAGMLSSAVVLALLWRRSDCERQHGVERRMER